MTETQEPSSRTLQPASEPDFIVKWTDSGKTTRLWRLHRKALSQLPYYEQWFTGPFGDNGESTLEGELVGSLEGVEFVWAYLYSRLGVEYTGPSSNIGAIQARISGQENCTSKTCNCVLADFVELVGQACKSFQPLDFFCADMIRGSVMEAVMKWIEKVHKFGTPSLAMSLLPVLHEYKTVPGGIANQYYDSLKILAPSIELWKRPVALYNDDLKLDVARNIPPTISNWFALRRLRNRIKASKIKTQWEELLDLAESQVIRGLPHRESNAERTAECIKNAVDRNDTLELLRRMGALKRDAGELDSTSYALFKNFLLGVTRRLAFVEKRSSKKYKRREEVMEADMFEVLDQPEFADLKRSLQSVENFTEEYSDLRFGYIPDRLTKRGGKRFP